MYSDCYIRLREEKIYQYIQEGFDREQVTIAVKYMFYSLAPILVKYESELPPVSDRFATLILNHMYNAEQSSSEFSIDEEYHFKKFRVFLNKDESAILKRLYLYNEEINPPSSEKLPRYLSILVEIANDFLELSLEEFKNNAKTALLEKIFEEQQEQKLHQAVENSDKNRGIVVEKESARKPLQKVNENWCSQYPESGVGGATRVTWSESLLNIKKIPPEGKQKKIGSKRVTM